MMVPTLTPEEGAAEALADGVAEVVPTERVVCGSTLAGEVTNLVGAVRTTVLVEVELVVVLVEAEEEEVVEDSVEEEVSVEELVLVLVVGVGWGLEVVGGLLGEEVDVSGGGGLAEGVELGAWLSEELDPAPGFGAVTEGFWLPPAPGPSPGTKPLAWRFILRAVFLC